MHVSILLQITGNDDAIICGHHLSDDSDGRSNLRFQFLTTFRRLLITAAASR